MISRFLGRFCLLSCFFIITINSVFADNIITVSKKEVQANSITTISVSLNNSDAVSAFQLMIPLDKQFTYVDQSIATTTRTAGHSITASVTNNVLKIYGYSLNNAVIGGNSGDVATFSLKASTNPGDYVLQPSEVVLSDVAGKEVASFAVAGAVTLKAPYLVVQENAVDLGRVPLRQAQPRELTLSNTGNEELIISQAAFDKSWFSVTNSLPMSIPAGSTSTLNTNFVSADEGALTSTLSMQTNAPAVATKKVSFSALSYSVNELSMTNGSGTAGEEVTIGVKVKNMADICGMQLSIPLPATVSYVEGSAAVSSRASGHSVTASYANNLLKLVLFSMNNTPITGNDGEVLTFRLLLAGNGYCTLSPQGAILSNPKGENKLSDVFSSSLEMRCPSINISTNSVPFADSPVNQSADASFNVSNYGNANLVIKEARFSNPDFSLVTSLPLTIESWQNADLKVRFSNGKAGTYTGVMKLYSNDPQQPVKEINLSASRFEPNYLSIDTVKTVLGTSAQLSVSLKNYSPATALQFLLHYPSANLTLDGNQAKLSGRCSNHTLNVTRVDANTLRFIIFSMNSTPFNGTEGSIVTVPATTTSSATPGDYQVSLSDVVVSSTAGSDVVSSKNGVGLVKVEKISQTINWDQTIAPIKIDEQTELTATTTSGLAITYESSNPTVAAVIQLNEKTYIKGIAAGNVTITAKQAGNDKYLTATDLTKTITVEKLSQALTWDQTIAPIKIDEQTELTATTTSGLAITYESSNPTVATIIQQDGKTYVKGIAAGNVTITAKQAGSDKYGDAASVTKSVTITKVEQTLTWDQTIAPIKIDEQTELTATTTSGLAITYESSNPAVATIIQLNGKTYVKGIAAGSVTITAKQAGSDKYLTATDLTKTITVEKLSQALTWDQTIAPIKIDEQTELTATTTSGLAITYESSNPAIAAIIQQDGKTYIKGIAAGSVTITAKQAGSDKYLTATDLTKTITVEKLSQTLTWDQTIAPIKIDEQTELTATTTSGLAITYESSNPAVAAIIQLNSKTYIKGVAAGSVTITAKQAGSDKYLTATDLTKTITVEKLSQALTWDQTIAPIKIDEQAELIASSTSGLAITYESGNPAVAAIIQLNGKTYVKGIAAGTVTITAKQAGSDKYGDAAGITKSITIAKVEQTISWDQTITPISIGSEVLLTATTNSGLAITYTSSNPEIAAIEVRGNTVVVKGMKAGDATITAVQSGNDKYLPTESLTKGVSIIKLTQSLSWDQTIAPIKIDEQTELTATTTSGLAITYESSNLAVAAMIQLNGKTYIKGIAAGSVTITAKQAGSDKYGDAASVTKSVTITKVEQTINWDQTITSVSIGSEVLLTGAATSGLAITYTSSNPDIAAIEVRGNTVVVKGMKAGDATITAVQSGNEKYLPTESLTKGVSIIKLTQSLTWDQTIAPIKIDEQTELTATTTSGLAITYESSNPAVAAIIQLNGKTYIKGIAAGSVTITAKQAGSDKYGDAVGITKSVTITKVEQTINWDQAIAPIKIDEQTELTATTTSGLAITYESSNPAVAAIIQLNGKTYIKGIAAGNVTITAKQAGSDKYGDAAGITKSVTITKVEQTITWDQTIAPIKIDEQTELTATTTSGLAITYESSNPVVAAIIQLNGKTYIKGIAAGTVTITAKQAGSDKYGDAASVTKSVTITKVEQTINWDQTIAPIKIDEQTELTATTTSGLAITYESSNPAVAAIIQLNGKTYIKGVAAGTVTITAKQAGNDKFLTATNLTKTITVEKLSQALTWDQTIAPIKIDEQTELTATTTSGLAITYESSNPAVAAIIQLNGKTYIKGTSAGSVTITAKQAGSDKYGDAASVTKSVNITKVEQTITWDQTIEIMDIGTEIELTANASSGLAASYVSSDNGIASIVERNGKVYLTAHKSGKAIVTASQSGTEKYLAAYSLTKEVTVVKLAQTINWEQDLTKVVKGTEVELTATATSGLAVTYETSDPTIAVILVKDQKCYAKFLLPGIVTISAKQGGDDTYKVAETILQNITVESAVAISEIELQGRVYPNPARQMLNIDNWDNLFDQFTIYTLQGSAMQNGELQPALNHIDLVTRIPGIYLLHLRGNGIHKEMKIVIKP